MVLYRLSENLGAFLGVPIMKVFGVLKVPKYEV